MDNALPFCFLLSLFFLRGGCFWLEPITNHRTVRWNDRSHGIGPPWLNVFHPVPARNSQAFPFSGGQKLGGPFCYSDGDYTFRITYGPGPVGLSNFKGVFCVFHFILLKHLHDKKIFSLISSRENFHQAALPLHIQK